MREPPPRTGDRDERGEGSAALREGARRAFPFAIVALVLGFSFGALARPVMGPVAAIVMSAIVFAGAAQFAAIAVLAAGGGALPAIVAGILLNLRFIPMGVAIAPWVPGGRRARAARGQALVDASWALSHRGGGRFDADVLVGATLVQYPLWVVGTVVGVLAGPALGDPRALGLDAVVPAFFLALLAEEARGGRALAVAAGAAALALALVPLTPPGIPVVAASLVALAGLRAAP